MVKTEKAVELDSLIENFGKTEDIITYLQSASLFKYIYKRYDTEQVRLFWQRGSIHIQDTLRTDLRKLQQDWRASLLKRNLDTSKIDWDEILEKGCG